MSDAELDRDPETLRAVYAMLGQERIDYNVRKWDVLRVASVFALGMFAAAGGLLSADRTSPTADVVTGILLPAASAMLWFWAHQGIRRESALQYRTEYSMYLIEKLLGLHRPMGEPDDRWLPDEPYMFGRKHRTWTFAAQGDGGGPQHRDLEWWVQQKVSNHGFVGHVDLLFGSFFVASLAFGVSLVLLGVG